MEQAGKAIWAALQRVAQPERPLDFLAAVWPLVVGRRMAEYTRPVGWERGHVQVEVTDREWLRQLERLGSEVRKQINRWWGTNAVKEVTFVRARQTGTRERKAASTPKPAKPASAGRAVNLDRVFEDFEDSMKQIGDKELRQLVARVARKYLPPKE